MTEQTIFEDEVLDAITTLIHHEGQRLVDVSDLIHFDSDLEYLLPAIVEVILSYESATAHGVNAQRVMFQIFDIITRLVTEGKS
jgi:hypothetical protein